MHILPIVHLLLAGSCVALPAVLQLGDCTLSSEPSSSAISSTCEIGGGGNACSCSQLVGSAARASFRVSGGGPSTWAEVEIMCSTGYHKSTNFFWTEGGTWHVAQWTNTSAGVAPPSVFATDAAGEPCSVDPTSASMCAAASLVLHVDLPAHCLAPILNVRRHSAVAVMEPFSPPPPLPPAAPPPPTRHLVARIGTSSKWNWDFAGWYTAGQLFDDGDCLAAASSECKLVGWDTLPVDRVVFETDDYSMTVRPSAAVPSLAQQPLQAIFQHFRSLPSSVIVPVTDLSVANSAAFTWMGETTRHGICEGGTGVQITNLLQASSAQDHGFYFNYYYEYQAGHSNYGGSHPRGHAWIGVGNSGSNSHRPAETSNCIAGFGVDTRGPDDPTTGYATFENSAGTTFVRPGADYSTVAVYVWS